MRVLLTLALLASSLPLGASSLSEQVRAWRKAHEREIVGELSTLLSVKNVATEVADIEANARLLTAMLAQRKFSTRVLSAGPGTPPAVYAERQTPGARRTVVFYAHFDGQPAGQQGWLSDPWQPVVRAWPLGPEPEALDLAAVSGPLDPEWRLFARSASDDKGPIVALLAALDALDAAGVAPSVNLKLFLEGEEEQGSPHLTAILRQNAALLAADAWILCDGPVHQTRRMQVYFGARGVSGLEITVYGPLRPLHSGHYGNWAPNPAVMLVHLLAQLRDTDGKILIPGFYDDVRPLSQAEIAALAALPDVESALQDELGLGRTESPGERLMNAIMRPSLNLRGLRSANVGEGGANAIPTEAQASIDFRMVPDQSPEKIQAQVEGYLRSLGWHLVSEIPDRAVRLAQPRIARLQWSLDYPAARTPMDLPVSKAVLAIVEEAAGGPIVAAPMLGGSVPISMFVDTLKVPVIGVPMVNHDNNQHGINENLRLQNLWDGIEIYAELFARLGEVW